MQSGSVGSPRPFLAISQAWRKRQCRHGANSTCSTRSAPNWRRQSIRRKTGPTTFRTPSMRPRCGRRTMSGDSPTRPSATKEKEEEQWELNTYVTCEVLSWKGVWNAEERRRRGNNDIGLSLYYDFPYYGRWVLCAARMLVDKNHVSLLELLEKIAEVRARYAKP